MQTDDVAIIREALLEKRAHLDRVLAALNGESTSRRGRPPKDPVAHAIISAIAPAPPKPKVEPPVGPKPKKRKFSMATRRAMAEAQKKRWAAKASPKAKAKVQEAGA